MKKKKFYKTPDQSHHSKDQVRAKKHLGQHFLKDESIAQRIADTLGMENYTNVLEIGPGTGILTKYLLKKELDLYAMDLDTESIDYLRNSFLLEHSLLNAPHGVFEILEADFLKYDLSKLFGAESFAITGNFPYNISTQIVFKALEWRSQIPEFTGMFQKEVAQRICEKHGSKTYGILSVLAQTYYQAEYLFTVPPEVFSPPPKVESGVLRLKRKDGFELGCDEKLYFRLVKTAFGQRRKTIRNSLKPFNLSEELRETEVFSLRPEQLSVEDFIELCTKVEQDLN